MYLPRNGERKRVVVTCELFEREERIRPNLRSDYSSLELMYSIIMSCVDTLPHQIISCCITVQYVVQLFQRRGQHGTVLYIIPLDVQYCTSDMSAGLRMDERPTYSARKGKDLE